MSDEPVDLDRLDEFAKKATPGPWTDTRDERGYASRIVAGLVDPHKPGAIVDVVRKSGIGMPSSPEGQSNAAFIAAANPATVRALVARARRAQEAYALLAKDADMFEKMRLAWDVGDNRRNDVVSRAAELRAFLESP